MVDQSIVQYMCAPQSVAGWSRGYRKTNRIGAHWSASLQEVGENIVVGPSACRMSEHIGFHLCGLMS